MSGIRRSTHSLGLKVLGTQRLKKSSYPDQIIWKGLHDENNLDGDHTYVNAIFSMYIELEDKLTVKLNL